MTIHTMRLVSDAIGRDGQFDPRYTCDLDNSSPELRWEEVPPEIKEFAVLTEDLDTEGGPFTHWVIYHIPSHVHHLPAGIPPQEALPNGIRQGINDMGKLGYTGPCPPIGARPHRYRFRLFGLNSSVSLPSRARSQDLLQALQTRLIAEAEITGKYQRTIQRAG